MASPTWRPDDRRKVGRRASILVRAVSCVSLDDICWNQTYIDAFENCKPAILHRITLAQRDEDKRLCIKTVAIDSHWSGIVTQVPRTHQSLHHSEQGHEPLAFHSDGFSKAQIGWATLEKEVFAVMELLSTRIAPLMWGRFRLIHRLQKPHIHFQSTRNYARHRTGDKASVKLGCSSVLLQLRLPPHQRRWKRLDRLNDTLEDFDNDMSPYHHLTASRRKNVFWTPSANWWRSGGQLKHLEPRVQINC